MNKFVRKLTTTVLAAASVLLVAACGANVDAASTTPNKNAGISDSVALAYDPADSSLLKADHDGLQRWRMATGWETVKTPQTSNLSSIVVNPDKPTTIYISGVGLGVARSYDGGTNLLT